MGANPSQHLAESAAQEDVQWPLQDDMGVVIALPPPPPLKQSQQQPQQNGGGGINIQSATKLTGSDFIGRRVLAIQSGSPAAKSGLVPWLDFIIGVEGRLFAGDEDNVLEKIAAEPGRRNKLHVYNIKTNSIRDCVIIPASTSRPTPTTGTKNDAADENHKPSTTNGTHSSGGGYLGLKISSWQVPDVDGMDRSVRVLAVERNSPAYECGMEPETDFLMGSCEHGPFTSLDDLEYALYDKEGKVLEMFVYNSAQDDIRLVQLRPRTGWSPRGGLLGAELANGILHRVPGSCRRTSGRDRATAGEQSLSQNDIVRTPEGMGELLVRHPDGSVTVRLDWGLGNDCQVIGKFVAKNVDYVAAASSS